MLIISLWMSYQILSLNSRSVLSFLYLFFLPSFSTSPLGLLTWPCSPAGTHLCPISSTLLWEASQFWISAGGHVEIHRSRCSAFHQGSVLSGICFSPFLSFTVICHQVVGSETTTWHGEDTLDIWVTYMSRVCVWCCQLS